MLNFPEVKNSMKWIHYLWLQIILFAILFESWMNTEANRSAVFAKPAIVIEESETVDLHRVTLLLDDNKPSDDDVEF